MAMSAVVPMIAPHMASHPPLHEGTERRAASGLNHEMKMIGHQAKRQNLHRMLGFGGGQQIEESLIISIAMKHRRAPIPTIEDMEGVTRQLATRDPRHAGERTR